MTASTPDSSQIAEYPEASQETLTERMARGKLSFSETLRHATEIATVLRDLHKQGLAYGTVSSRWIVLGPSGATLRNTGLARLGDGHFDVTAFGAVLNEMLGRADIGPKALCEELRALAVHCQDEAPDMQQVLIGLRLLKLQARQAAGSMRQPAVVQHVPAVASESPHLAETLREYIRTARQWRPLACLAAFALSGK